MLKVAFIGALAASFAGATRAHLSLPAQFLHAEEAAPTAVLAEADVLVTLLFTAEMAAAAPRLRLVQVPGAGLDRIERQSLPAGVALANAYGHETGIAEYVLGGMLALAREFPRLDAGLRRGDWLSQWAVGRPAPAPWPSLSGKTLGILGYGRIGRAVAARARAFGMRVVAMRRHAAASAGENLDLVGGAAILDRILAEADYLLVALPLVPETRGLLDARALGLMKATAVLINVARAEIVDEDVLYAALADGRLAGAVLDVWYRYPSAPGATPPSRRPFHALANVLMTPHIAGWTEATLDSRARTIAGNIERLARGEPLLNLVAAPV